MKAPATIPGAAAPRDTDLMRRPPYRPGLAMQQAAQRAAVQPPLIHAVTTVDNYRGLPEGRRK